MESEPPIETELVEKPKKKKKLGTSRGIETLFRNTYRVHVEVSALADSKANFLISVNSILLILIVSHGMKYVDSAHTLLYLPISIVLLTSIGSMIFAVLVARPRISHDNDPGGYHQKGGFNLLFFGSFIKLSREEFIDRLSAEIRQPDKLYPAMMADIYDMGVVLKRKFRRLKTAYGFLLYGMPVGIALFVLLEALIQTGTLQPDN